MTAYDVNGAREGPAGITRRGILGAVAGTAALLAGP